MVKGPTTDANSFTLALCFSCIKLGEVCLKVSWKGQLGGGVCSLRCLISLSVPLATFFLLAHLCYYSDIQISTGLQYSKADKWF